MVTIDYTVPSRGSRAQGAAAERAGYPVGSAVVTFHTPFFPPTMTDHLSQSDRDRIRQFVNTPRYRRNPDQLVPEEE